MKQTDTLHSRNSKGVSIYRTFGLVCFCLSALFVFQMTGITPNCGFDGSIQSSGITLIPIAGIADIIQTSAESQNFDFALRNLGGNIILFAPFGFFLPLLWKNYRSIFRTAAAGMFLSVMIEVSQLFIHRGTDVDDVILNTLGTCLGYMIFVIASKVLPKTVERISGFHPAMKTKGVLAPWSLIIPMFTMIMGISYLGCIL